MERIGRYAERGRDAFLADELVQIWMVHHLQIIGEAAARIPGVCRAVLVLAVADHEIVLSPPIAAEYREVGRRPKHRPHRDTMDTVTGLLEGVAIAVESDHPPFGLSDPDDEIYLATAVAASARALVTVNLRHCPQALCGTVSILTPRRFLDCCG